MEGTFDEGFVRYIEEVRYDVSEKLFGCKRE